MFNGVVPKFTIECDVDVLTFLKERVVGLSKVLLSVESRNVEVGFGLGIHDDRIGLFLLVGVILVFEFE